MDKSQIMDRIHELGRLVHELHTEVARVPVREAKTHAGAAEIVHGTATELIDAKELSGAIGGTGDVILTLGVPGGEPHVTAINVTGRPVWKGSYVTMVSVAGLYYIVATNAAPIIYGEWDGVGPANEFESYTFTTAGGWGLDTSDCTNADFYVGDSQGLFSSLTAGGVLAFSTGAHTPSLKYNAIFAIGGGSGSGGGSTWVGFPGPDPTTGTQPGKVFAARVNLGTGGVSNASTIDFDNATGGFGTAPADPGGGIADNPAGRCFVDNEWILVAGDEAGNYTAFKLTETICKASTNGVVNFSNNTSFTIDGFQAITGEAPVGVTGTAAGHARLQLPDNYVATFVLKDNATWQCLKEPIAFRAIVTTAITARTTATADGSGVVTLYKMNSPGSYSTTGALTGVTVRNSTLFSAPVNAIIQVKEIDGSLYWDVADCPVS